MDLAFFTALKLLSYYTPTLGFTFEEMLGILQADLCIGRNSFRLRGKAGSIYNCGDCLLHHEYVENLRQATSNCSIVLRAVVRKAFHVGYTECCKPK